MLFNSYIFILLFFPLCLVGYYGLNKIKKHNIAMVFLLGMSLWFYGYFNLGYLLIIISSILLNFAIYKILGRLSDKKIKKLCLVAGLAANIAILGYFKYTDFFISTLNSVAKTDFNLINVVLPLGISFFTFQQLSFVIDSYKGEVGNYSFIEYACFVTYFPQLIAGPIVTHDELVPQFKDMSKKSISWDNFSRGLFIFVLGMTKKVMVADMFGNAVNVGF
ncbi:MAG: MBOAT family protein, partial [Oscillospiraceae bacterium]|nr:MBOAT family protein [Oscillospiraceae bacterium]